MPAPLPCLRVSNKLLPLAALLSAVAFSGVPSVAKSAEPRTLPPPGIAVPPEDAERLKAKLARLNKLLGDWKTQSATPAAQALTPDVEMLLKSVDYALRDGSFYNLREIGWADAQLKLAAERIAAFQSGEHPWTTARGLVARGFRSRLDNSAQPYGLVIPEDLDLTKPAPLYVWLHGRGDTALDLQFIHQRLTSAGQIRPSGAIVLHPFARYCNGFKSAGEVDVFEAIAEVERAYKIDPERIVLMGFSMGGAGVWHIGAHYPDRWAAVSPGAGFVDVRRYQNLTPDKYPPWYEQTLWNVYDVPAYARNLLNVPLYAYSGELDKQKQAADLMEESLREQGLAMTHIIGPGVGHKYEPKALIELMSQLRGAEQRGRNRHPAEVHLQTRTLRYNRCFWIETLRLGEHWRDTRVDATRQGDDSVDLKTVNVARLRVDSPWPTPPAENVTLTIDSQPITVENAAWKEGVTLQKETTGWRRCTPAELAAEVAKDSTAALAKSPGLQGPIDDAFVEPFLVVRPTGKSTQPAVAEWVASEQARFKERWRLLFRGEIQEVDDVDVTDEQLAKYNVLVWGDPSSNRLLARMTDKLPVKWDSQNIRAGKLAWPSAGHAVAMIYPNPLPAGRGRYVVLNSGMTFREADDRTNSLQNPKLPDWAVFDLSTPPDTKSAGRVADAGFFDEGWQYQDSRQIPGDAGQ